jgi:hypothetical protein
MGRREYTETTLKLGHLHYIKKGNKYIPIIYFQRGYRLAGTQQSPSWGYKFGVLTKRVDGDYTLKYATYLADDIPEVYGCSNDAKHNAILASFCKLQFKGMMFLKDRVPILHLLCPKAHEVDMFICNTHSNGWLRIKGHLTPISELTYAAYSIGKLTSEGATYSINFSTQDLKDSYLPSVLASISTEGKETYPIEELVDDIFSYKVYDLLSAW